MADDFKIVKRGRATFNVFEVKGLNALESELERMEKEFRTELGKQAVKDTCKPIEARVKSNIRTGGIVDTSALLDSVRTTVHHSKRPAGIRGDVRAGVAKRGAYKKTKRRKPHYALQIEYGTSDANPWGATPERPFMRPAFDGKERQIANHLKLQLNRKIVRWKMNNGRM